jgi:hypothetical protein
MMPLAAATMATTMAKKAIFFQISFLLMSIPNSYPNPYIGRFARIAQCPIVCKRFGRHATGASLVGKRGFVTNL